MATDETPLTDEEAEAMLKRLSRHFHEPVMPIKRYCAALEAWAKAMQERATHLMEETYPNIHADYYKDASLKPLAEAAYEKYRADKESGDRYALSRREGREMTKHDYAIEELRRYESQAESIGFVFLQIHKSSLLDRLLYCGQKLRTKRCPEHKGHWIGLESDLNYCKFGCGFTGWLPEPEDASPYPPGVFIWTSVGADGAVTELRKDGKPYIPENQS
jgi:hypothetical protein